MPPSLNVDGVVSHTMSRGPSDASKNSATLFWIISTTLKKHIFPRESTLMSRSIKSRKMGVRNSTTLG